MLLEVSIPEDSTPGSKITVQCPNGKFFEFIIPDSVKPGDVVNVLVPDTVQQRSNEEASEAVHNSGTSEGSSTLPGRAAVGATATDVKKYVSRGSAIVAGAVVGTLIVGPIVTGIVVVGALAYSAHHDKKRRERVAATTAAANRISEDDNNISELEVSSSGSNNGDIEVSSSSSVREQQIAETFSGMADGFCANISALDERIGVSRITLKAITKAQEIDERAKLSETVTNSIRGINERYDVSGAVVRGYDQLQDFDNRNRISERVGSVGSSLLGCMDTVERRYDLTNNVVSALTSGATVVASGIAYAVPAAAATTTGDVPMDRSLDPAEPTAEPAAVPPPPPSPASDAGATTTAAAAATEGVPANASEVSTDPSTNTVDDTKSSCRDSETPLVEKKL